MLIRLGRMTFGACCALVLAGLLAGCGGNQAPVSTGTVAPPAPMSETQRETQALPLAKAAPIPKTLHCKGDIVWVNLSKKTYHASGDPYFGRTKNGQYMCKAAADAAGYHMAGAHHKMKSMKSMQNEMPTPAPAYT